MVSNRPQLPRICAGRPIANDPLRCPGVHDATPRRAERCGVHRRQSGSVSCLQNTTPPKPFLTRPAGSGGARAMPACGCWGPDRPSRSTARASVQRRRRSCRRQRLSLPVRHTQDRNHLDLHRYRHAGDHGIELLARFRATIKRLPG